MVDKRVAKNNGDNLVLRRNIEKAIWASLDPISAQRAIDNLNPILKDLSGPDVKHRQQKRSNNSSNQQQIIGQIQRKGHRTRRKCDHSVTLPSIQSILIDYRSQVTLERKLVATSSSGSVSEPINGANMFQNDYSPLTSRGLSNKLKHQYQQYPQQHQLQSQLLQQHQHQTPNSSNSSGSALVYQQSPYNADAGRVIILFPLFLCPIYHSFSL
jgi:hypothetical protein